MQSLHVTAWLGMVAHDPGVQTELRAQRLHCSDGSVVFALTQTLATTFLSRTVPLNFGLYFALSFALSSNRQRLNW